MISISIFFIALATTVPAKGSIECDFSESTGARQCFGAVGQLLIFHLPNTENIIIRLKKDDKYMILKIQKNQIVNAHEQYVNTSELFPNGTIKLGNAVKRHSGDYLMEEFGSDGLLLKTVNVQLHIQAAVSKPAVSQMCVSPEQIISCSSEGDGVELILTLDNLLLGQARGHSQSRTANMESLAGRQSEQDKPSVSNVTISLHGQLTGNLMCHAWNNVSRDETVILLKSCKVSPFPVVTVAVTANATLLFLVALCLGIIKLHKKTRSAAVNEGNNEDEIVYADVKIRRKDNQLTSECNMILS